MRVIIEIKQYVLQTIEITYRGIEGFKWFEHIRRMNDEHIPKVLIDS